MKLSDEGLRVLIQHGSRFGHHHPGRVTFDIIVGAILDGLLVSIAGPVGVLGQLVSSGVTLAKSRH